MIDDPTHALQEALENLGGEPFPAAAVDYL
jgi:hypothetical protein